MKSMLYVPADRPERAIRSWRFKPDAVILDLEDGVSMASKEKARASLNEILESSNSEWYIRINSLQSDMLKDDIKYIIHENLKGIIVPKVEYDNDIWFLERILRIYSLKEGKNTNSLKIIPIIESAKGAANLRAIANSSRRILALGFGGGDFCLDLGVKWDPSSPLIRNLMYQISIESRNAGLERPHDSVYPNYNDLETLRSVCLESKSMGFGTKHAIHPNQIPVINDAFSPTKDEIEWAKKIKEEFESPESKDKGVIGIESNMIDRPVYLNALRILRDSE